MGSGDTKHFEGDGCGGIGETGLNDLGAGSGEQHEFGLGTGAGAGGVQGDADMIGWVQAVFGEDETLGIVQSAEEHAGMEGGEGAAGAEITGDRFDGFDLAMTVFEDEPEGAMRLAGVGCFASRQEGWGLGGWWRLGWKRVCRGELKGRG
jgi:hypothetical protein